MTLTLLTSTIISTSEIEAALVVHGACNMVFTLGLRPFYAPQVFVARTKKGVRSLFGNLGSKSGFSLLDLSIGFTFFGVSQCHVPAGRILQGASTML